jgi:putative phage-type endonuclease
MNEPIQHDLQQGTAAWHQYRATKLNASDAPAMMGVSPYKKREQLLAERKTGYTPEVDAETQKRFDRGHQYEADIRPSIEAAYGIELYPVTLSRLVDGLDLSASFDGLTMDNGIVFEHKSLNDELRQAHARGELPEHYRYQLEQQLLVSGAKMAIFVASKGSMDDALIWDYEPDAETQSRLLAGWKRFQQDLETFEPPKTEAKPVGVAPESLPYLQIELSGAVVASNIVQFRDSAIQVFRGINKNLVTDDDFASADKTVKWCASVEEKLKAAKERAQAQMADVDAVFRAVDEIAAEARTVRLELEKLVKARKDEIRQSIIMVATKKYNDTYGKATEEFGFKPDATPPNFITAVKGLKTVVSVQAAVDTELRLAEIALETVCKRLAENKAWFDANHKDDKTLFPDLPTLLHKDAETCRALVFARIETRKAEEARRAAEKAIVEKAAEARAEEAQTVTVSTSASSAVASGGGSRAPKEDVIAAIVEQVSQLPKPKQLEVLNFAISLRQKAAA